MTAGGKSVCLGAITGAHGVKGWVRIRPFTEQPEAVAAYGPLFSADGRRRFVIAEIRPGKGALLARLEGVSDRDAAQALKGVTLHVARAALPEIAEEETWYQADLVGLKALDRDGEPLGEVTAVHDFGAGDLLEIKAGGGAEIFLPFTRANVPEIDLAAGTLTIVPPAGLIEDAD